MIFAISAAEQHINTHSASTCNLPSHFSITSFLSFGPPGLEHKLVICWCDLTELSETRWHPHPPPFFQIWGWWTENLSISVSYGFFSSSLVLLSLQGSVAECLNFPVRFCSLFAAWQWKMVRQLGSLCRATQGQTTQHLAAKHCLRGFLACAPGCCLCSASRFISALPPSFFSVLDSFARSSHPPQRCWEATAGPGGAFFDCPIL